MVYFMLNLGFENDCRLCKWPFSALRKPKLSVNNKFSSTKPTLN
jgi:hypothetical protein